MGRCSNLLVNLDAEGLDDVSDGLLAAGVEHPVLYGAVVTGHRIDEGWNGVRERLISIGKKICSTRPKFGSLTVEGHSYPIGSF